MQGNAALVALGFGFLSAFFWGTHSVIVRFLTHDMPGLTIGVIRLYVAAGTLYLIMKLYREPVRISFKDRNFLITTFGAASNYVFFHWGLEYTKASSAMMLENTAPFFVLLFVFLFLRERVTLVQAGATLVAIVGVYFTVAHDLQIGGDGLFGDVLEVFAGLTWAIFMLGSSQALSDSQSTVHRISFLFSVLLVSALLLTPLAFLSPLDVTAVPTVDWLLLIVLGVFPTAAAYYLWYEAAARISAVPASLLFTLTIVSTLINAHIFLGEALTSNMILGAALIVAGVLLSKLDIKGR